jgi:hypothetical protein
VVEDRDRLSFLATGRITAERRRTKVVTNGDLWIGQLDEIWEQLGRYPRLGQVADVYRGLKWWKQGDGLSPTPREMFVPGVFKPATSLSQFSLQNTSYVNMRPEDAMFPGPLTRPWKEPKVLTNVARLSRGPWRIAAAFDRSGLVPSQAFFGIWSTSEALPVEALEAIINGPLTNAFLTEHASNQHFTNELLKQLPLPRLERIPPILDALRRYHTARDQIRGYALQPVGADDQLAALLVDVDAAVLKAYDLSPRLERRLLEFFRGYEQDRRLDHAFKGWIPEDFTAYIPLHEYTGKLVRENLGSWALEVFSPAPEDEVQHLRQYIH